MKALAHLDDIPFDRGLSVAWGDRRIALFRIGNEVHAVEDSCPHQGASLANGRLDGVHVKCPAHGLQFDVRDGCMKGNAGFGARSVEVRVLGDQVLVDEPAST